MKSLEQLLAESAARHPSLCPRQVLGVRMGMLAGKCLGLDLPQTDKRLYAIVETDGCATDGIAVVTNCWVGRRNMWIEDYGKVAATFVDTQTGSAIRVTPSLDARERALQYAPGVSDHWQAMLIGYQRMPDGELLCAQPVKLGVAIEQLLHRPERRVDCDKCHEEIMNGREIHTDGGVLCRACASPAYYRLLHPADG